MDSAPGGAVAEEADQRTKHTMLGEALQAFEETTDERARTYGIKLVELLREWQRTCNERCPVLSQKRLPTLSETKTSYYQRNKDRLRAYARAYYARKYASVNGRSKRHAGLGPKFRT